MTSKDLTEDWRTWLRMNIARGCAKEDLLQRCVEQEGFSREQVEQELGMRQPSSLKSPNDNSSKPPTSSSTAKTEFVNNGWKEWIQLQLENRQQSLEEVFVRLAIQEGLDLDQVSQAMGGYRGRTQSTLVSQSHSEPPFTKRGFLPRAWKLDTSLVELYEIPNFLTQQECQQVIALIDKEHANNKLQRSTVSAGSQDSRTSKTCHLSLRDYDDNSIVAIVEQKLQKLMNYNPVLSGAEPLQGQWYGPGEYFQPHCDWFNSDKEEHELHCKVGGQRTWTVMIYLNFVKEGGTTYFEHLNREFVPIPGLALAWNNLDADNATPNPWALHEAKPVVSGTKYVLTKWFRERPL